MGGGRGGSCGRCVLFFVLGLGESSGSEGTSGNSGVVVAVAVVAAAVAAAAVEVTAGAANTAAVNTAAATPRAGVAAGIASGGTLIDGAVDGPPLSPLVAAVQGGHAAILTRTPSGLHM